MKEDPILFLGLEDHGDLTIIHFYRGGEHQWALLDNRGEIPGGLLQGSEITLELRPGEKQGMKLMRGVLRGGPDDFLPGEFLAMLEREPPEERTAFGFISAPSYEGSGRYYSLLKGETPSHRLITGKYGISGEEGQCEPPDRSWVIPYGLVENYLLNRNWPSGSALLWKDSPCGTEEQADYLSPEDLTLTYRNRIVRNRTLHYYFSANWSPEFYRKQAKLGFIAVSGLRAGKRHLIPELQNAYAVLDWQNLKYGRKVAEILKKGRLKSENIRLVIDGDPRSVLKNLECNWKKSNWLKAEYGALVNRLGEEEERLKDSSFRIWGVTLTAGSYGIPVAGELGYTIGRTYTSLSGFFRRDLKQYNNFGKLQMVLLARVLEKSGIAFWNLGHPQMQYKLDLGAEILDREDFLGRWDEAIAGDSPDLAGQISGFAP